MLIIKILAVIAFFGSIAWAIAAPDYESVIAMFTSLSTLIAAFVYQKKQVKNQTQKQSISENGFGLQAGGDLNVGNINTSKESGPNAG